MRSRAAPGGESTEEGMVPAFLAKVTYPRTSAATPGQAHVYLCILPHGWVMVFGSAVAGDFPRSPVLWSGGWGLGWGRGQGRGAGCSTAVSKKM